MSKTKQLVFCSLFTALIAVGAFIKIPVPVVPFTLQYLFTMLAGLILGPRLGTISVAAELWLYHRLLHRDLRDRHARRQTEKAHRSPLSCCKSRRPCRSVRRRYDLLLRDLQLRAEHPHCGGPAVPVLLCSCRSRRHRTERSWCSFNQASRSASGAQRHLDRLRNAQYSSGGNGSKILTSTRR